MLNQGENVEKRLRQGSVYRFTVRLKNDEEQCWLFEEIALLPDTSVALPMKYAFLSLCPAINLQCFSHLDDGRLYMHAYAAAGAYMPRTLPTRALLWVIVASKSAIQDTRVSGAGFATVFHSVIGKCLFFVCREPVTIDRHSNEWDYTKMSWCPVLLEPGDDL